MQSIRHLGQWFWRVGETERPHRASCGEHRQSVRLSVPERLDLVRPGALALSDLVFILDVVVSSRETIESLLQGSDLFLVGTSFPQLRQRFSGEVLECDAIGPDILSQG